MAEVDYGIESIKFAPVVGDGSFPKFETAENAVSIQMIDIDSFTMEEAENNTTDVEFENFDILTLTGSQGKKTITFTASDTSGNIGKIFKGYKEGTAGNEGYLVNDPLHTDTSVWAMQVKTKALDEFPAKVYEYTPVSVVVKKTGTIGSNNLGKYTFSITRKPNVDASGNKLSNYREKAL